MKHYFSLPEGILILIKDYLNISKEYFEETTENCQHRDHFESWCYCLRAKSKLEISPVNNEIQLKVLRSRDNKFDKLKESSKCPKLVAETSKAGQTPSVV